MASLPHFPAAELEAFYFCRIQALSADMAKEALAPLVIRFCHWMPSGQFTPWIGFRSVLEEAQRDKANAKVKRPALIFGIHSSDFIPANDDTAILDWPGAKYLRYDVDDAELLAAFKGCLANCSQALPPHLQAKQTPQALLKLLALVRHQFEGEIDPIEDRLEHLSEVLEGEQFKPSHAEVPQVFKLDQEKMLDRLNGYTSFSLALAPEVEGLKPFNDALQTFRRQWEDVSKLSLLVPDGGQTATHAAIEGWQRVQLTVDQIISDVQSLEKALKSSLEKIK
jgi:hypothetical protein